jgi:hypothetical protein
MVIIYEVTDTVCTYVFMYLLFKIFLPSVKCAQNILVISDLGQQKLRHYIYGKLQAVYLVYRLNFEPGIL